MKRVLQPTLGLLLFLFVLSWSLWHAAGRAGEAGRAVQETVCLVSGVPYIPLEGCV